MYQLSRVCVINYGHNDARFKSALADFRRKKDGRVAKSVMLFAPNGKGKTTFLSFMLHAFVPDKKRFVQTLQKPDHRFHQYFREGQPGIIFIEITRRSESLVNSQRDLVESDIPVLIIGAVINRKGDSLDERFFMIDPTLNQYRLEHVDFLAPVLEGRRADIKSDEVESWLKAGRAGIKGFNVITTQQEWSAALTAKGFNLHAFDVMVTMASKEGGIEKFLGSKNPDEILGRVFNLFIDEEQHRAIVDELANFLHDNQRLPVERKNLQTLEKLVELEDAFSVSFAKRSDLAGEYDTARSFARSAWNHLVGERDALATEQARLENEINHLKSSMEVDRNALEELTVGREAYRYAKACKELSSAESNLKLCAADRAKAAIDQAVWRSVSFHRRRLSARAAVESKRNELHQARQESNAVMAPLHMAGARLLQAMRQEATGIASTIDLKKASVKDLDGRIGELENRHSALDNELSALSRRLVLIRKAREKIAVLLETAAALSGDGNNIATISEAKSARDQLRLAVGEAANDMALANQHFDRQTLRLETSSKDCARALKELAKAETEASRAGTNLEAHTTSVSKISPDLEYLKPGENWDLDDPRLPNELREDEAKYARLAAGLETEIAELRNNLSFVDQTAMFEDADVKRALERCRAIGVTDVSPFSNWISKNIPHVEDARSFVESNLHISLGLRVRDAADLEKINKSFDRRAWNLRKPISVAVARSADQSSLADDQQIVLSAENDYAYHEETRQQRESELKAEIEARNVSLSRAREYKDRVSSVMHALTDHKSKFHGRTKVEIEDIFKRADEALTAAKDLAEYTKATVQTCQENIEAARAKCHAAETSHAVLKEREEAFIGLFDELSSLERAAEINIVLGAEDLRAATMRDELQGMSDTLRELRAAKDEANRSIGVISNQLEQLKNDMASVEFHDAEPSEDTIVPTVEFATKEYRVQLDLYKSKADADVRTKQIEEEIERHHREIKDADRLVSDSAGHLVDDPDFIGLLDERSRLSEAECEAEKAINDRRLSELDAERDNLLGQISVLKEKARISSEFHGRTDAVLKEQIDPQADINELISVIEEASILIERRTTSLKDAAAVSTQLQDRHLSAIKEHGVISERIVRFERLAGNAAASPDFILPAQHDWDAFCKTLEKQIGAAGRALSSADAEAVSHHRKIIDLVNDPKHQLTTPDFRERVTQFKDHVDHGQHSSKLLEILRRKAEQSNATIVLSEQTRDNVVISVGNLAEKAVQKILRASTIKAPETGSRFSGLPIIKLPEGIDRQQLANVDLKNVVTALIDQKLSDYADLDAGLVKTIKKVETASELCVDIMRAIAKQFGKDAFKLRILKPVDQSDTHVWEEIHALTGSGGQTITAALLLNLVATALHGNEINSSLAQAFMILDNPIGVANSKSLVGIQMMMAETFGIQMIATSGINDNYLTCYDWIVSFDVTTKVGGTHETSIHYNDNNIVLHNHRLKTHKDAA